MQPIKPKHMILLFLAAAATVIAVFGFNFFAAGYSLSDLTAFFLAKDSRVQERLIMQPGTGTGVSIVAGTQTDTWLGDPDDPTLPRIELDGATGEWKYKNRNAGTQTTKIGDVQSGSLSAYVEKNGGTLTEGTLAGSTTIPSGGQFLANGRTVTNVEISYLDGLPDFLTTLLDAKEDDANKGVANGYASLDANGKVVQLSASGVNTIRGSSGDLMSGQIDIILEGDIVGTSTYDAGNKYGSQTIALTLGASNKPNILMGEVVVGTQSAEISFDAVGFGVSQDGNRSIIALSDTLSNKNFDILKIIGTTTDKTQQDYTQIYVRQEAADGEGTAMLLHCDNPGSTTVTDVSGRPKTVTLSGNAIGTTTAKFGSGSVYLDGTNDYFSIADSPDLDLGLNKEPYTLELWMDSNDYTSVFYNRGGGTDAWNSTTGHQMLLFEDGGGTSFSHWTGTSSTTIYCGGIYSLTGFVHVAISYDGTYTRVFVNGDQKGTGTAPYAKPLNSDKAYIGRYLHTSGVYDMTGYIDEVCITKGIAKYTANFTPSASELSASFEKYIKSTTEIIPANESGKILAIESGTSTVQRNIARFVSPDSINNPKNIFLIVGTSTQILRNFEVVEGLTTLADSWDTRCDPKIKEITNEDGEALAALSYEKIKQLNIKQWQLRADPGGHKFLGVMIDDPNIPEEIIWRTENGQPGGFSGVGFMNYLLAIQKEAIKKQDAQQLEIQQLNATIGSMTAEIEALKSK